MAVMTFEPEKLAVSVNDLDEITALIYRASGKTRARVTVILGHGAGANQLSPFMRLFASGLAERGIDAITFNFVYMEQGKRVPDKNDKLENCYRAVIEAAREHKVLKGNRLVIGGKSMGGRIASQVAAGEELSDTIDGLVFLGYPLHPPGRPDKLRDAHLKNIRAPMLFIQGARDAFGTVEEIRAVIKRLKLPAVLHAIEGGDHSLKVPKSSGMSQAQVYEKIMDEITSWAGSL